MLRVVALVLLVGSVVFVPPALAQEEVAVAPEEEVAVAPEEEAVAPEEEVAVAPEEEVAVAPEEVAASSSPAAAEGGADGVGAGLIAAGEKLFQQTAGGVGCQYCHGKDAKGNVGPNVRGKSPEQIKQALGTVLVMSFISTATPLTEADIQALAAYLKYLESQP